MSLTVRDRGRGRGLTGHPRDRSPHRPSETGERKIYLSLDLVETDPNCYRRYRVNNDRILETAMSHLHLNTFLNPSHVTVGLHSPGERPSLRSVVDYLGSIDYDTLRSAHRHHGHSEAEESVAFPNFDIRETADAYFLEGEFPGIRDPNSIFIERLGTRGLLVEARSTKLDLEKEWGVKVKAGGHYGEASRDHGTGYGRRSSKSPDRHPVAVSSGESRSSPSEEHRHSVSFKEPSGPTTEKEDRIQEWLSERNIGCLQRSFSFPQNIDYDRLEARLQDGLLRIKLPKSGTVEERHRFAIDFRS